MRNEPQPKVVLDLPASSTRRSVTIVRDDRKPRDMRFEVIYQDPRVPGGVGWRFAATRKAADAIASEVR